NVQSFQSEHVIDALLVQFPKKPHPRTSNRSSQGVFSHRCLRKASAAHPVSTGLGGSAGIADTLACVNPECQRFRRPGEAQLIVRKVYGHARIRLLRCRSCGEACSERRGRALCNTKLPEATAADVINHLGEGGRVKAPARLVKVAKETVARLV